jgi:hypothetical protein
MTIKLFQSTAAVLRRAESFAKAALRAPRAGSHGPFNPGNEAPPSRYFGLLVHLDRSDR